MISFQIISEAGDARSKAKDAVTAAQKGDFTQADQLISEAKECLRKAHQMQTDMINGEVNGEAVTVDVLLVHAQDHFSMATSAIDMGEYVIDLLKRVEKLEKERG